MYFKRLLSTQNVCLLQYETGVRVETRHAFMNCLSHQCKSLIMLDDILRVCLDIYWSLTRTNQQPIFFTWLYIQWITRTLNWILLVQATEPPYWQPRFWSRASVSHGCIIVNLHFKTRSPWEGAESVALHVWKKPRLVTFVIVNIPKGSPII